MMPGFDKAQLQTISFVNRRERSSRAVGRPRIQVRANQSFDK
ncbi:hypothetical protein SAMN05421868_106158 [Paenibacillus naphthalenovorans]|nr:hypothetical protein SAMN05421868_106158 [Paenibacillus naphthalenovorans]